MKDLHKKGQENVGTEVKVKDRIYSIFKSKNVTKPVENKEKAQEFESFDFKLPDENFVKKQDMCCPADCLKDIDINIIRENEQFWKPLEGFEFKKEFLHHLYDQSKFVQTVKEDQILMFGGQLVCKCAFAKITGKSLHCVTQVLKMRFKGIKRVVPKGKQPRIKPKTTPLVSWMETVAIPKYGNCVPNKNEIRFPPSLSWKTIFLEYQERLSLSGKTICPATFYRAIDANYGRCRDPLLNNPRIMIENSSSHGKCDLCAKIIEIRAKSAKEEEIDFCAVLEFPDSLDFAHWGTINKILNYRICMTCMIYMTNKLAE